MKLIELFAGIGTQYEAFKTYIDTEVVAISEIDQRPLKVYKELHGDFNNLGDITKIKKLPYADIWTYSFPCTDLSIAGNKKGLEGANSSLLYEVLRLLENSEKPKILIMENVSNLVSSKFLKGFEEWITLLKEKGYTTTWEKIKGYEYGGGSIRNRVFAVSVLGENIFKFPFKTGTKKTVKDFLEEPNQSLLVSSNIEGLKDNKISYTNSIKIADYGRGGQGNRIYSINGQAITITASGGGHGSSSGLYLRKDGIYKLSSIEMAKIMGWSEEQSKIISKTLSHNQVGFVLGNSIELNVMKKIAESVIEQYFK